jgi:hypothetical protein
MIATSSSEGSRAEAERQLAASAARHREIAATMQEPGRPAAGQHVAAKSVGRAVQLVSFALKRTAAVAIPFERLVALTGWEPDLARERLDRAVPEPWFMARLAPAGADAHAVVQAAAGFEALARLRALTQRVLADVDAEADEQSLPAPDDVDDLHDRLEATWRSWREGPQRQET